MRDSLTPPSTLIHWLLISIPAIALGCGTTPEPSAEAAFAELGLSDRDSTYAELVPRDRQTGIELQADGRVRIDSADGRVFFPMPRTTRRFATRRDFVEYLMRELGGEGIYNESGTLVGAGGAYGMHGDSYFRDGDTGLTYRVRDPLLALVAGVRGVIEVAGEELCLDPDRSCEESLASYLEPEGVLTSPTHVQVCGIPGACMTFHSFFNKTWFPWPWARHGSNVKLSGVAAGSGTQLLTAGFLTADTFDHSLNTETNVGQASVETAHWSAFVEPTYCGSAACAAWNATAVCGSGMGVHPDIGMGSEPTANGPESWRCP